MELKKIFKIITLIIICIFMIFILTGCSNEEKDKEKIKNKVNEELEYISNKIILLLNKTNNISFSSYTLKVESNNENLTNSQSESTKTSENSSQGGSNSGSSDKQSVNSSTKSEDGEKSNRYELVQGGILTDKEEIIDWRYIKSEVENLSSIWPTIVIDLHSINVDNNDILSFGNSLDNLTVVVNTENKQKTLNLLSTLYSYIPKYKKQYNDNSKNINISYTIANIVNSYVLIEENRWEEVKSVLASSKEYYSNIINGIENNGEEQNKFNKVYVLLNELDNSINLKDKDLYYIKYKNLMESIIKL